MAIVFAIPKSDTTRPIAPMEAMNASSSKKTTLMFLSSSTALSVAKPALRHRLIRSFEGEADGVTTDAVVDALLAAVPARPDRVEAERKA